MARVVARLVFDRLPELRGQLRVRASAIVRKTALDVEARAKASMDGPRSGRLYRRPGGQVHQASAPGEPPAVDTGTLKNSLQAAMESDLVAVVFSDVEYAPYLELGTRRMAPRPFLGPAVEAVRPAFEAAMKRLLG